MCRSEQGKPPMKLASDSCVREAFGSAKFVFFFLFLFVGKGKSFAYEQEIFLKFAFFFLSRKLECLMSGKFMTWLDGKCVVNILMLRKSNLAKFNSCYCFRRIFKLRRFSFCGFFINFLQSRWDCWESLKSSGKSKWFLIFLHFLKKHSNWWSYEKCSQDSRRYLSLCLDS